MEPSTLIDQARDAFDQAVSLAQDWLLSPAAWSQFALLIGAYLLARLANRILAPRLTKLLTPDADNQSLLATARRFVLTFLPQFAYGFTAIGETVTRSLFGSGVAIAFGKRVFLFLAARALAKHIVTAPSRRPTRTGRARLRAARIWRQWDQFLCRILSQWDRRRQKQVFL
jgi:potassium efflux system protein